MAGSSQFGSLCVLAIILAVLLSLSPSLWSLSLADLLSTLSLTVSQLPLFLSHINSKNCPQLLSAVILPLLCASIPSATCFQHLFLFQTFTSHSVRSLTPLCSTMHLFLLWPCSPHLFAFSSSSCSPVCSGVPSPLNSLWFSSHLPVLVCTPLSLTFSFQSAT